MPVRTSGDPTALSGRPGRGTAAIGLPRSCTSAEWMLGFVTPPDVSKSFKVPPRFAREGRMYLKTRDGAGTHRSSGNLFTILQDRGVIISTTISCMSCMIQAPGCAQQEQSRRLDHGMS